MLEKEKFPQDYFPEVRPGRRPPWHTDRVHASGVRTRRS